MADVPFEIPGVGKDFLTSTTGLAVSTVLSVVNKTKIVKNNQNMILHRGVKKICRLQQVNLKIFR